LLVCVIGVALTEQGAMSLLPIYALRQHMTLAESSLTLVVMIGGSVVLQYPIGSFADRLARPVVMAMCAGVAALAVALLPWAAQIPGVFWFLIFVWGGTYYGIYTLSLVRLGECYSGTFLVAGSAAMGAMWGVGRPHRTAADRGCDEYPRSNRPAAGNRGGVRGHRRRLLGFHDAASVKSPSLRVEGRKNVSQISGLSLPR
jgi:hypothetical protein